MYLKIEEYPKDIKLSEFERLEFKARTKVDELTFGRFKSFENYPEELTKLMIELIDFYSSDTGDVVSSRSTSQGSVSQNESYVVDISTDKAKELIKQYLSDIWIDNMPITYRG